ncbi:hypothetical protein [Saccharibacillus alkalitolerans]|uniref:Uncharacterized protein n=1 Tax=Saccharibacillus alkalitolerans TaxID=2705290 RepID=A0ABX0FCS0_9BACL|nr:hypothetical protein [Saccharibacillus alkalitolerans]NGZ77403.1 hypothetical protein [Saccharibacillus alkalitolerans]
MAESRIVSGKIIEQRGNKVLTVQGGLVSSYDLRYYKLAPEETEFLPGRKEEAEAGTSPDPVVLSKWTRHAFSRPLEYEEEKSANRA